MGVTYKLKQEVIDFIVNQKRESPHLGCRSLAGMVSEKFQTIVSKSSINAVIKSADLSSPVGRRSDPGSPEKKFKIPQERKEQIFTAPKAETVIELPPPAVSAPSFVIAPAVKKIQKTVLPTSKMIDRGIFFDGMGAFFLKAAEWELNPPSLLGALLSKHVNIGALFDINAIGQVLLFLEAFGIHKLEDLKKYEGGGLWAVSGLSESLDYDVLRKTLQNIDDVHAFLLRASSENLQVFCEINYIKLILGNRMELCVDSQLNTIWPYNVHSAITAPVNKVMTFLSSQLINNVQPLILRTAPGEERIVASFYEMLGTFENIPGKKISQIALFDQHNEEFAQFNIFPDKKRTFIIGLRPSQQEFMLLAKQDNGQVYSLVLEEWNKTIYYSEITAAFPKEELIGKPLPLKIFFLRTSQGMMPQMAVVTNIPDGELSPQEIISAYVSRWPYFEQGWEEFKTHRGISSAQTGPQLEKETGDQEIVDIESCIKALLSNLNRYCQKHFYPSHYEKLDFNAIKNRFYNISGYMRKDQNTLFVHLSPPSDYHYWEDLEFTIRRINESAITNSLGLRLIMSCDSRLKA